MRNAFLALFGVLLIAAFLGEVAALVLLGGVVIGGVVWGLFFSRDTKIHRRLFAAPLRAIAGVQGQALAAGPDEAIRIRGEVERLDEELLAPITRRRCVYYFVLLEEYRREGLSRTKVWVEVVRLERAVDFLLRDDSGLARVRMHAAQVAVVRDLRGRSGFLDAPTAQELDFLERQCEQPTDAAGMNRTLRYTEGALELDEEVTALGVARPGDDRCRLVLDAPPGGHVLVTDEPSAVGSAAARSPA